MAALHSGARVEIFETIDSTNLEARRRAERGETGPLWIVGLSQTAGYGRRGSAWVQRDGDFAATFLFKPQGATSALPELAFVSALAVSDALARYGVKGAIRLKWPNDILADGAKISGILLELLGTADAPLVALGVGVNIVSAPTDVDYPAAKLIDYIATPPDPRAFVATLDLTFAAWRDRWEKQGFSDIRANWIERSAGVGEPIRVRTADGIVEGRFRDLDSRGALIVDCPGGPRSIAAGAVLPTTGAKGR